MVGATQIGGQAETTTQDPSMLQLVPRPSRTRNLILIAAVVVALVAAGFSPNILRPSVSQPDGSSGGMSSVLASHRQVMTASTMTTQTWPRVDVQSVDDVPGASAAGAWILEESDLASFDPPLDESNYESGLSFLTAAIPGFDADVDALPQPLGRGERSILMVLWNIENCADLEAGLGAFARVDLGTIIGTSATESLPDFAAPGFDVEFLRRTGACA